MRQALTPALSLEERGQQPMPDSSKRLGCYKGRCPQRLQIGRNTSMSCMNCRLGLLLVAASHIAFADPQPLYRWTDSEGRVHFTDHPPPGDAEVAEALVVPSYASPALAPADDPYSILNQSKRMEASRKHVERERRERRERDREYALRQRELEIREQALRASPASGAPVYAYPRPVRPHPPGPPGARWPDQRPSLPTLWPPEHPAYRPPHPLPARVTPGGRVPSAR